MTTRTPCPYCHGTGTYTGHERHPSGGGGTNREVICTCTAGHELGVKLLRLRTAVTTIRDDFRDRGDRLEEKGYGNGSVRDLERKGRGEAYLEAARKLTAALDGKSVARPWAEVAAETLELGEPCPHKCPCTSDMECVHDCTCEDA